MADLMRHEVTYLRLRYKMRHVGEVYLRYLFKAGLPNAGPMGVEDCLVANIKQNKVKFVKMLTAENQVGRVLEESEQEWPLVGRRQYHALSRSVCRLRFLRERDAFVNQGMDCK